MAGPCPDPFSAHSDLDLNVPDLGVEMFLAPPEGEKPTGVGYWGTSLWQVCCFICSTNRAIELDTHYCQDRGAWGSYLEVLSIRDLGQRDLDLN